MDYDRSSNGSLALFVDHKMLGANGEFLGIIGLVAHMDALVSFIDSEKIGQSGESYILDANGLVHKNKDFVLSKNFKDLPDLQDIADDVLNREKTVFTYTDSKGDKRLIFSTKMPMAGWILINDVSVREFYEPVYENLYKTLVYSLLFIILGAGFAYLMALYFSRSIAKLQAGIMDFFAYLRYERDEVAPIDLTNSDEIGEIARLINTEVQSTQKGLARNREAILQVQEVIKKVNIEDFSLQIDTIPANPHIKHLVKLIDEMKQALHTLLETSISVLRSFADGDFTERLDSGNYESEAKELFDKISTLGQTIGTMLNSELHIANALAEKSLNAKRFYEHAFCLHTGTDKRSYPSHR